MFLEVLVFQNLKNKTISLCLFLIVKFIFIFFLSVPFKIISYFDDFFESQIFLLHILILIKIFSLNIEKNQIKEILYVKSFLLIFCLCKSIKYTINYKVKLS